jgi:HK97 family phage major capsid protein
MAQVAALDVTANKGSLTSAPATSLLGRPTALFDGTGWDDSTAISAGEEIGCIGDFSNYYLIDRIGMSMRRDDSIYVANDQVGFFARSRYDGRVGLADAFRIFKIAAA